MPYRLINGYPLSEEGGLSEILVTIYQSIWLNAVRTWCDDFMYVGLRHTSNLKSSTHLLQFRIQARQSSASSIFMRVRTEQFGSLWTDFQEIWQINKKVKWNGEGFFRLVKGFIILEISLEMGELYCG
jgi:hypothetical protein